MKQKSDFFKPRDFDDAVAFLHKKYDKDVFVTKESVKSVERVPMNWYAFDKILGGGIPVGRIIEVFGPQDGGKTTLAGEFVKAFQARPDKNIVLYLDFEHSVDFDYMRSMGVSFDEKVWRFVQPFSLEEGVNVLGVLAYTGKLGLVIVDSVAAMTPEDMLTGEAASKTMGRLAQHMSESLNKLKGILNKTKTTCVFINQTRTKIGVMFGNPETTPGGDALKFYSSMRIRVASKKSEEYESGKLTRLRIVKNKTSADQMGKCEYHICPGRGYMAGLEAFDLALEHGMLKKSGKNYTWGKVIGSRDKFIDVFQDRPELRKKLYLSIEGK